jgi:hypothetical protein
MTDNELLEQLFRPAREMQIADDGFSEQVMRRLPQRRDVKWLSHVWTIFCVSVAVVLFTFMGGWQSIALGLFTWVSTLPNLQHLLMLVLTAGVLLVVAVTEVVRRELYRERLSVL